MKNLILQALGSGAATRNTGHRMLARAVDLARAALLIPIIARYLGPGDYGLWAVCMAVVLTLRPLAVVGLEETLLIQAARRPERTRATVAAVRRIGLLIAVVCLPVAGAVAYASSGARGFALAALLGGTLLIEAATISRTLLSVHLRDRALVPAQLAASVVFVAGTLAVVALDLGIFALGAVMLLQALVGNGVAAAAARGLAGPDGTPLPATPVIRDAAPRMLSGVALEAQLSLDVAIVAVLCGGAASGAYAAGWRVAALGLVLPYAISRSVLGTYAAASLERARALCVRLSLSMLALGCAAAVALWAGRDLLILIFGEQFAGLGPLMPLFGIRLALLFATSPLGDLLLARDGQVEVLWARMAGAAVGLGLPWLLIPIWGVPGAAAAAVAAELARGAWLLLAWNRRFGVAAATLKEAT